MRPPALLLRPGAELAVPPVTLAAVGLAHAAGAAWLHATLPAVFFFPFWAAAIAAGRPRLAAFRAGLWALTLSIGVFCLSLAKGEAVAGELWGGARYADEMLGWIRTGVGPEGSLLSFLPRLAGEVLLFAALCLVSGGLLGLVLGTVLLDFMNYYAGLLVLLADEPAAALCRVWPVYAIVRVAGFILIAVGLARPALARVLETAGGRGLERRWLAAGVLCLVADVALKVLLAESQRRALLAALGG
jgi:hypothetical protein